MCNKSGWITTVAPLLGAIQSLAWIGLSITSGLVYLCVITVDSYKDTNDFLQVTVIKLYFEGPECIPDGTYLGQFNKDYRNPNVLSLFTPDKVFAVMIAYLILNAVYFILSIMFYLNRKPESPVQLQRQRELIMGWSLVTLVICIADFVFTARLILDVINLHVYMGDKRENAEVYTSAANGNLAEIPYIPLLLALISSRFIGIWVWNLVMGLILFFTALCCKSPGLTKTEKKQEKHHHLETVESKEDRSTSMSDVNRSWSSLLRKNIESSTDFLKQRSSMEAVTKFNTPIEIRDKTQNWSYVPKESLFQSSMAHTSKEPWEMTNEGFVEEETLTNKPENYPDFDHNLKNFEPGERKIKISKPHPIGKPVSIPVPPPLPTSGSCNC